MKRFSEELNKGWGHISYHLIVVILSAAFRPMGPLVDALSQLGAECSHLGAPGRPPLSVKGPITGSKATVEAGISSQFVSSLLIPCSQKRGHTEIVLKGQLVSRPYVDITLQIMQEFGGHVEEDGDKFLVPGEQDLSRES